MQVDVIVERLLSVSYLHNSDMMLCVGGRAVVEGGLVQVDLEQLNTDNTFSLCTACGDVFVIQVREAHPDAVDV